MLYFEYLLGAQHHTERFLPLSKTQRAGERGTHFREEGTASWWPQQLAVTQCDSGGGPGACDRSRESGSDPATPWLSCSLSGPQFPHPDGCNTFACEDLMMNMALSAVPGTWKLSSSKRRKQARALFPKAESCLPRPAPPLRRPGFALTESGGVEAVERSPCQGTGEGTSQRDAAGREGAGGHADALKEARPQGTRLDKSLRKPRQGK